MESVKVTLSKTYAGAGGGFSSLAFRQPKWRDFVEFGDIEEWQPTALDDGGRPASFVLIRNEEAVAKYADRLLMSPHSPGDLELLNLADTLKVQGAIKDFFRDARTSSAPPIDSSGDTAKASPTSEA